MTSNPLLRQAVAILLGSLCMMAQGQSLLALAAQQYTGFEGVPTLNGRAYVLSLFDGLHAACPQTPREPFEILTAGLMSYSVFRNTGADPNKAAYGLGVTTQLAAYLGEHNGHEEATAFARSSSCDAPIHAGWLKGARRFLEEPQLGGDITQPAQAACNRFANNRVDCQCFARQFDWESTPAQRRQLLASTDSALGLQRMFADPGTAQRMSYKCPSAPDFGHVPIAPQQRSISVDPAMEYRGVWIPPGMSRAFEVRCIFRTTGESGSYRARCSRGVGKFFEGDASVEGTRLTVAWSETARRYSPGEPSGAQAPAELELHDDNGIYARAGSGTTFMLKLVRRP